jgi:hypothetical protein
MPDSGAKYSKVEELNMPKESGTYVTISYPFIF